MSFLFCLADLHEGIVFFMDYFRFQRSVFICFVCFILNLFLKANPVSIKSLLGVYLLVKEDYGKLECTDSSFEALGAPML